MDNYYFCTTYYIIVQLIYCVLFVKPVLYITDLNVKVVHCRMDLACQIALEATSTVAIEENGRREIDIKRYAKVEKVGKSPHKHKMQKAMM